VTRVKDEMAKVWVLDTETKGTGAQMVPLEKALKGDRPEGEPRARPRKRAARSADAAPGRQPAKARGGGRTESGPLPPGHVRKKATGEIGRIRSVDAKAGTATVLWLKQGRSSTVPLTAISRR
jgi:hypothetical protein